MQIQVAMEALGQTGSEGQRAVKAGVVKGVGIWQGMGEVSITFWTL